MLSIIVLLNHSLTAFCSGVYGIMISRKMPIFLQNFLIALPVSSPQLSHPNRLIFNPPMLHTSVNTETLRSSPGSSKQRIRGYNRQWTWRNISVLCHRGNRTTQTSLCTISSGLYLSTPASRDSHYRNAQTARSSYSTSCPTADWPPLSHRPHPPLPDRRKKKNNLFAVLKSSQCLPPRKLLHSPSGASRTTPLFTITTGVSSFLITVNIELSFAMCSDALFSIPHFNSFYTPVGATKLTTFAHTWIFCTCFFFTGFRFDS